HHYCAPGYTVGEAGKYRYYPKRREVGHGALAEKALSRVIPDGEVFPYTIRVVSEIMSQSGSSSMASVCGSTVSLMDAGVPIKKPVAGIAIGVVTNDDLSEFELLTDMGDFEDYYGDMDFKVAGTRDGITAIQMDNKKNGLPIKIFKQALVQAKSAREFILDRIEEVIKEPRVKLSKYAPKIDIVNIKSRKVGELIGPGGKVVKNIIEKTGVEIDINDSGRVAVSSSSDKKRKEALGMIEDVVGEAEIGKEYKGKVAKVMDFGAFVDVTPSISGLVHVSEMSNEYVKDPRKFVTEGQDITVKVIGIDEQGRVKMSIKQVKDKKE
ncbi:MAG: S1 RNA-binding domain-containing protein, partial [Patescibacteria group bacterium]|nr:S1 RNA-binding domain-containing protein [Patescibacteria group bacterium]